MAKYRSQCSDVLPVCVDGLGRCFLWFWILPGLPHLGWCPIVEARVGPVVVALDVAADSSAGLVDGFVFVEPYLSFFELAEPGFDEGLGGFRARTRPDRPCPRQRSASGGRTRS